MTAFTFGPAIFGPLFDIRAAWNAIEEVVGAAFGALSFAAVVWTLLAMPGLLG